MADYEWMISKCHNVLEPNVVAEFENVLHIYPTWKVVNKISYDYLQKDLTEPIAILRAQMGTNKEGGNNYCAKSNVLPVIAAICAGAIVMLLNNKVVEENLHNGSVGVVCDICYKPGETMGTKGAQLYVVVKFHKSNLSKPLMAGQTNAKLIPIPICRQQCDKQCCWIETVPIRVCKGLTCHKTQGMSIGLGEQFENAQIHMPQGNEEHTWMGINSFHTPQESN